MNRKRGFNFVYVQFIVVQCPSSYTYMYSYIRVGYVNKWREENRNQ